MASGMGLSISGILLSPWEPFPTGRVGPVVNPRAGTLFAINALSDRVLIAGGLVVVISTSIQANDID
jgi:hypothetical protein